MTLTVLSSGSSGNCYVIQNETEALIIEAGVPFKEVKKALDFNVMKIKGVIASHIHSDHAGRINEYEKSGILTCKPYDISEHIFASFNHMGKFKIRDFHLKHDVPCYGFVIEHPDMGRLLYASDTEYIKYRFKNINHILIEANYDKDTIPDDAENREHVFMGHMEISTTCDFVKANDNPNLHEVVLLHLSEKNADSDDFQKRVSAVTNKPVYVARKGLTVDVSLLPEWCR